MTTQEIADALNCTIRHARRLKAARDPRVLELEKADTADMPDAFWREMAREIDAQGTSRPADNISPEMWAQVMAELKAKYPEMN